MTKLIFVYGTLKRGHHNHRLLEKATFLGEATTVDDSFLMMHNRSFPYVIGNGKFFVKGELYEVDESSVVYLDRLEGHPDFYIRTVTSVRLFDGTIVDCEMYVASASTAERVRTSCVHILPNTDNELEWVP